MNEKKQEGEPRTIRTATETSRRLATARIKIAKATHKLRAVTDRHTLESIEDQHREDL